MSILNKVRKWIDGETSELVLEEAARHAKIKPRSKAEEFIVKIARAVEEVMQHEMVPLPQGATLLPPEYIVFLSDADDKEWQGAKRRGLEQGLYHILSERANEIAGTNPPDPNGRITITFKIDGTLEKESIRVQHSWAEHRENKTQVIRNPVNAAAPSEADSEHETPEEAHLKTSGQTPNEDLTILRPRRVELFRLEIWREGTRQKVVPVSTETTVIGRGSVSRPVDIELLGDAEISRRHLVLTFESPDSIWLLNEGRNPVTINNKEIVTGERLEIQPGVFVSVCSFALRIQPAQLAQRILTADFKLPMS